MPYGGDGGASARAEGQELGTGSTIMRVGMAPRRIAAIARASFQRSGLMRPSPASAREGCAATSRSGEWYMPPEGVLFLRKGKVDDTRVDDSIEVQVVPLQCNSMPVRPSEHSPITIRIRLGGFLRVGMGFHTRTGNGGLHRIAKTTEGCIVAEVGHAGPRRSWRTAGPRHRQSRIGHAARSVTAERNSAHGLRHRRPTHRISRCETDRMTHTASIPRMCRTPRTVSGNG